MNSPMVNQAQVLKIRENDNVGTAITNIALGDLVEVLLDDEPESTIVALEAIPLAHKMALRDIAGEAVVKYGECIGQAELDILSGYHVHVHNIKSVRGRS